jgi:anti-sigma B factor antagonist
MPELTIKRQDLNNGVTEFKVSGFLDAHTFESLEDAMAEAFGEERYRFVVDLAGIEYISSAGAGVFIGAHSEAQENGGDIVLLNPSENVKQVFDLLGLGAIFTIATSREQAVATFNG